MQPKYLCSHDKSFTNPFKCEPQATKTLPGFCGTDLYYEIDWSQEYSLKNWFVDLNLECVSKARIGFIGSSLFLGWALFALIVPRLSDLHGRKAVFQWCMVLQIAAFFGLYFSHNVDLTTGVMFFFGVASVGRATNSFLYMSEVLPQNRKVLMATMLQIIVGCVPAIGSVYFTRISKDWLWLEIWAGALTVACLLATFAMPESPKYLISKKRYNEARVALNYIGKFNGVAAQFNGRFDKEVFEEEVDQMTTSLRSTDNDQTMTPVVESP